MSVSARMEPWAASPLISMRALAAVEWSIREINGEPGMPAIAMLPTPSRQQTPLAGERMDRSSMMVMILDPLSANLPRSYTGSFMTAHTACPLRSPCTCALILLAFSCGYQLLHHWL